MRIITQDGTSSVEFDGNTIYQQDDTICLYDGNNHCWKLGKYATEADATWVFMDMHKQWTEDPLSVFEMPLEKPPFDES